MTPATALARGLNTASVGRPLAAADGSGLPGLGVHTNEVLSGHDAVGRARLQVERREVDVEDLATVILVAADEVDLAHSLAGRLLDDLQKAARVFGETRGGQLDRQVTVKSPTAGAVRLHPRPRDLRLLQLIR